MTFVPTIKDIAQLAQVSKTTVSLALSGDSRISEETRHKIKAIAEQLGYIPNRMARGLSRSQSQTIGVLFYGSLSSPLEDLFSDTLMGIGHEALQVGYNVVLLGFSRQTQGEPTDWTDQVIRSGVDGLIVISAVTPLHGFDKLHAMRFPIVFVGKRESHGIPLQETNYVSTDQFGAGRAAADYLKGLGHRDLAVVAQQSMEMWLEDRIHGFFSSDRALLQNMNDRVYTFPDDFADENLFARMLAKRHTAFFAITPSIGLELLHALQQAGIRVPQDVSLIVYDDFSSASFQRPPLTVMKQDMRSLGQLSFQRVLELAASPDAGAKQILISAILIERDSCAAAE